MNKIIKQLQYTSNLQTIDRLLRIHIDDKIAIKYLPSLSLATKYHLLNKGSLDLKKIVIANLQQKSLPDDFTLGQLFNTVLQKIINFGIKPNPPTYEDDLLKYLHLRQKIKLFNKIQHKYFNESIQEDILSYIEQDIPIDTKCSQLLKWLYFQDDKTYQQFLPIITNIILHQQNGVLTTKAHKYISLQFEKIKESQYENVQLFLELYPNMEIQFMKTKNTRNKILLKLRLHQLLQLDYPLDEVIIASKKYNNLDDIKSIQFYLNYPLSLDWLIQQILEKQIINHKYKTQIVALINHILKICYKDEYINTLFDQVMDAFEPEEVYYEELKYILEFLLIIKNYPQTVLVQIFRIFADKHILFDSKEFCDILLLINKFEDINIQDSSQSYQISVFEEVKEYYLKNALHMSKEIHQIFVQRALKKLN